MKETENINKETEDETEVENLKQKIIKTIIKKTIDEFKAQHCTQRKEFTN